MDSIFGIDWDGDGDTDSMDDAIMMDILDEEDSSSSQTDEDD